MIGLRACVFGLLAAALAATGGAGCRPPAPRAAVRGQLIPGTTPYPLIEDATCGARYPPMALQQGRQGTTVLRVNVDADGIPREADVVTGADPILDEAARRTMLERCRFSPAVDGTTREPVASVINYRFVWILDESAE